MLSRADPGRCPICGAEHTACTTNSGPVAVAQLPARDAAKVLTAPLVAERVQATLPPGSFTSGTYRGKKQK